MADIGNYMRGLLKSKNIDISGKRSRVFDEFINQEENMLDFSQIVSSQNALITKFMYKTKVFDIVNQHLPIPNGTVGKPYTYKFDISKLGHGEIIYTRIDHLEPYGLVYDNETETISGTPILSGDFKISLQFKIKGESESLDLNQKPLTLVINADPKSLWKNIASDEGKADEWKKNNFWKPDHAEAADALGEKHIVVSSKRGRSHANVGSFRDDDYAFKHFDDTGWSLVCVADGAGSSKLSRQGSKLACEGIVSFFSDHLADESFIQFDTLLKNHYEHATDTTQKELNVFLYNNLGKAVFSVHKNLQETANQMEVPLKDFHSTLIFALFKKYEFGYAILTFGVGDCPIGLLNKDMSEIKLMNWLDVGEFGGGTRFITMPEIFNSDKFPTRFGFKLIDDFSYLMLMTDGIYDPKFEVEANLEKLEQWKTFIADLQGKNDDHIRVEFEAKNKKIAEQLSSWMDFWSPGNHDDRTLAIVF